MDRLTYWDDDGKHGKMKPGDFMSQKVVDRLAAYEDTGLTPEEILACCNQKKARRNPRAFVPPTLEEVAAYARERNSAVDPKVFYDFFNTPNSAGETWVDSNGKKVKNWKQKFITWESKGGHAQPQRRQESYFMNYNQRRYTNDELRAMGLPMPGEV